MNNGETILIASTSKAVQEIIITRLKEIGAVNSKIVGVHSDEELQDGLCKCRPNYLLIEGSFYRGATPVQLWQFLKKYMSLRIFVFGFHEYSEHYLKSFLRTGVDGYLDMRQDKCGFNKDLKCALTGKTVIPHQFAGMTFDCVMPAHSNNLTFRDMEIVHLILEDLENKEIAKVLHLNEQSVKNRRRAIYDKLQVTSIVGLLKQTFRKRLIGLEEFLAS